VNQQVKAYLISYLRLFAAAAIAAYLVLGTAPLDLQWEDAKALLNAGIGALIVSIGNALNPADNRYGIGAPKAKELSAGDVATNTDEGGYAIIELLIGLIVGIILLIVLFKLLAYL
jgi:hypothetical protein